MASRQRIGRDLGVRLLHVEVDEVFLLGLSGAVPQEWVVTSLPTYEACARLPVGRIWDACLLGVSGEHGEVGESLECLVHLQRIGCPLLVWMPAELAPYVPAMKALGVAGFVSRSAPAPQVRRAIHDVVGGGVYMDERLRSVLPSQQPAAPPDLTELQKRVAGLYVLHGNRRLVARDLHVSENTVKYHLRRIYAKTGASSVHELHKLLLTWGWEPLEG